MSSVYHEGEHFIQELMGVREQSNSLSSMIQNEIPLVAAQFLRGLNFCVMTFSLDNQALFSYTPTSKELVSCVVYGLNTFIEVKNNNEIFIDLHKKSFIPSSIMDAISINVGLLGLDFENRMRIRVNGKGKILNNQLQLTVNEVYSNCPKYIHNRKIVDVIEFDKKAYVQEYVELNHECKKLIANSNTFFISSYHMKKGADISHKGGDKGFLKVLSSTQLEFEDYPGNNMYNSLGNIYTNPHVSVLIIDFESNDILHIKGKAKITNNEENEKRLKVIISCNAISIEKNTFFLKYNK